MYISYSDSPLLISGRDDSERMNTRIVSRFSHRLQEVSVRPANLVNQAIFEEPWIACLSLELKTLGYVKLISSKLQVCCFELSFSVSVR